MASGGASVAAARDAGATERSVGADRPSSPVRRRRRSPPTRSRRVRADPRTTPSSWPPSNASSTESSSSLPLIGACRARGAAARRRRARGSCAAVAWERVVNRATPLHEPHSDTHDPNALFTTWREEQMHLLTRAPRSRDGDPVRAPGRLRRFGAVIATTAVAAAGMVGLAASSASAAEQTITNATFEWGISSQMQSSTHIGPTTCHFFSTGETRSTSSGNVHADERHGEHPQERCGADLGEQVRRRRHRAPSTRRCTVDRWHRDRRPRDRRGDASASPGSCG